MPGRCFWVRFSFFAHEKKEKEQEGIKEKE